MRKILDFLFGNIFRLIITAIAVIFAVTHYPIAMDDGIQYFVIGFGLMGYVIGFAYGYAAQTTFFDKQRSRWAVVLVWIALTAVPSLAIMAHITSYQSTLHPTSLANVRALTLVVAITITHALFAVIYSIVTTKIISAPTHTRSIRSGGVARQ